MLSNYLPWGDPGGYEAEMQAQQMDFAEWALSSNQVVNFQRRLREMSDDSSSHRPDHSILCECERCNKFWDKVYSDMAAAIKAERATELPEFGSGKGRYTGLV